jgi:hypothetical protein
MRSRWAQTMKTHGILLCVPVSAPLSVSASSPLGRLRGYVNLSKGEG